MKNEKLKKDVPINSGSGEPILLDRFVANFLE